MSEIIDWHIIDRVLDTPEKDWRELAIAGGVTPQCLQDVIPALGDEESQDEAKELLTLYKSEIENLITLFEDIPPDKLLEINELVVFEVWNLPVQSIDELRVTVDELVRQNNPGILEPA